MFLATMPKLTIPAACLSLLIASSILAADPTPKAAKPRATVGAYYFDGWAGSNTRWKDDPAWAAIPRTAGTVHYGFGPDADLRAVDLALGSSGSGFRLEGRFCIRDVSLPLPGEFNVTNALGAAALLAGPASASEAIIKKARCVACHSVDKKLVGPAYKDVAAKYRGQSDALDKLAAKVRNGGAGAAEGERDGSADPAAASGDEADFPVQPELRVAHVSAPVRRHAGRYFRRPSCSAIARFSLYCVSRNFL